MRRRRPRIAEEEPSLESQGRVPGFGSTRTFLSNCQPSIIPPTTGSGQHPPRQPAQVRPGFVNNRLHPYTISQPQPRPEVSPNVMQPSESNVPSLGPPDVTTRPRFRTNEFANPENSRRAGVPPHLGARSLISLSNTSPFNTGRHQSSGVLRNGGPFNTASPYFQAPTQHDTPEQKGAPDPPRYGFHGTVRRTSEKGEPKQDQTIRLPGSSSPQSNMLYRIGADLAGANQQSTASSMQSGVPTVSSLAGSVPSQRTAETSNSRSSRNTESDTNLSRRRNSRFGADGSGQGTNKTRNHSNGTPSGLQPDQRQTHHRNEDTEDREKIGSRRDRARTSLNVQTPHVTLNPRQQTISNTTTSMTLKAPTIIMVPAIRHNNGAQAGNGAVDPVSTFIYVFCPSLTILKPAIKPSHPPVPNPSDPQILTLLIRNLQNPPQYTQIQLSRSRKFGPCLVHYCEQHGQRFRFDWNFVYWFPDPIPSDPNHQKGITLHWEHRPCDFDDDQMPAAKMNHGAILELMTTADLKAQKSGAAVVDEAESSAMLTHFSRENWHLRNAMAQYRQQVSILNTQVAALSKELAELKMALNTTPRVDEDHDMEDVAVQTAEDEAETNIEGYDNNVDEEKENRSPAPPSVLEPPATQNDEE